MPLILSASGRLRAARFWLTKYRVITDADRPDHRSSGKLDRQVQQIEEPPLLLQRQHLPVAMGASARDESGHSQAVHGRQLLHVRTFDAIRR